MSQVTVDKEELSHYRNHIVSQGIGAGTATACFAFGATALPKVGFAGGVLFGGATVVSWYFNRDRYQKIRKAIQDSTGDTQ